MKRVPMIATKALRYGTRRIRAGAEFEVTASEARVYQAVGLASDAPRQTVVTKVVQAAPPAPGLSGAGGGEIEQAESGLAFLRAEYELKAGRAPDRRWGADRLRAKIAALDTVGGADETTQGDDAE